MLTQRDDRKSGCVVICLEPATANTTSGYRVEIVGANDPLACIVGGRKLRKVATGSTRRALANPRPTNRRRCHGICHSLILTRCAAPKFRTRRSVQFTGTSLHPRSAHDGVIPKWTNGEGVLSVAAPYPQSRPCVGRTPIAAPLVREGLPQSFRRARPGACLDWEEPRIRLSNQIAQFNVEILVLDPCYDASA